MPFHDMNLSTMLGLDEDAQPGGARERFIMQLLANASRKRGYQSLQLPALSLLLGGEMRGFDKSRQQQGQLANQLKLMQLQSLIEERESTIEKRKQEMLESQRATAGREGLISKLLGGVPPQVNVDVAEGDMPVITQPGRGPTREEQLAAHMLRAYPGQAAGTIERLLTPKGREFHFIPPSPGAPARAVPKDAPEKGAIDIAGTELPEKPDKAPSVGPDREALAQADGYDSYANAPTEKKRQYNQVIEQRQEFRQNLQLRSQGRNVRDSRIQALTPTEARTILRDQSLVDRILEGALGAPAPEPPTTASQSEPQALSEEQKRAKVKQYLERAQRELKAESLNNPEVIKKAKELARKDGFAF